MPPMLNPSTARGRSCSGLYSVGSVTTSKRMDAGTLPAGDSGQELDVIVLAERHGVGGVGNELTVDEHPVGTAHTAGIVLQDRPQPWVADFQVRQRLAQRGRGQRDRTLVIDKAQQQTCEPN